MSMQSEIDSGVAWPERTEGGGHRLSDPDPSKSPTVGTPICCCALPVRIQWTLRPAGIGRPERRTPFATIVIADFDSGPVGRVPRC